jgi:hypothetical protein
MAKKKKAFGKIQHPFMIKFQKRVGIEEMYLNIINVIYVKHKVNIILKLKPFSLKSGAR